MTKTGEVPGEALHRDAGVPGGAAGQVSPRTVAAPTGPAVVGLLRGPPVLPRSRSFPGTFPRVAWAPEFVSSRPGDAQRQHQAHVGRGGGILGGRALNSLWAGRTHSLNEFR